MSETYNKTAEETPEPSDVYTLQYPVEWGKGNEPITELRLQPNGRAMQGVSVETRADGGVVFEPYKFAELGLRFAGQPTAIAARMHPRDIFGLAMAAYFFFVGGPPTGGSASR